MSATVTAPGDGRIVHSWLEGAVSFVEEHANAAIGEIRYGQIQFAITIKIPYCYEHRCVSNRTNGRTMLASSQDPVQL